MSVSVAELSACFENEAAQIALHSFGFLHFVWLPGPQESPALRDALEALLCQLQRLQCEKVLVNQRHLTRLSVEDSAWYLLDWLPRATQQRYRYGAVLGPAPLLDRISTHAISQQAMQQFPVVHQYFEHEPPAIDWLQAQR